jgi:molecular chaperone IbpA
MSLQGGYAMRTYDLSPLYRSTVGFDRLFSLMDQVGGFEQASPSYPPYNIEKTGENAYRISLAVAGFTEADLAIQAEANSLVIRGDKAANADKSEADFLFQGIAARQFERRFQLADYVTVTAARLENGLLHVDLVREVPEAKKPRIIPIGEGPVLKTVEQIAA